MKNRMLLILDAQNGVLEKPIFEKDRTTGNINELIEAFRQNDLPIVLSRHTNTSSLVVGSDPWQIASDIAQPEGVRLFCRPTRTAPLSRTPGTLSVRYRQTHGHFVQGSERERGRPALLPVS